MALGARPLQVTGMVLAETAVPVAVGVGMGVVGAFGLTRLAEKMLYGVTPTDPVAFAALTRVKVPAHYLGDGVSLRAEHPIIGLDDRGAYRQIAYNNYDRAPFRLPAAQMREFYDALALWNRLVNDPAYENAINLRPGTALLFDNWRTLHGRRAYQGYRRLCGAYVNKEDFDSKLRVLRAASR